MKDKLRFTCLIGLLLLGTVDLRWRSHGHPMSPRSDFAAFPTHVADWSGRDLPDLSGGVKRVLAADNYLFREYRQDITGAQVAFVRCLLSFAAKRGCPPFSQELSSGSGLGAHRF